MTRYILHPGHVISKHDKQRHYVVARELCQLYGVDRADCVVYQQRGPFDPFKAVPRDIHLRPDPSGRYQLPGGGGL